MGHYASEMGYSKPAERDGICCDCGGKLKTDRLPQYAAGDHHKDARDCIRHLATLARSTPTPSDGGKA